MQVKGVSYSLEAFLGPSNFKNNNNNNAVNDSITSTTNATQVTSYFDKIKHENENTALYQCIIYLAPGDYHRFHSPTYWQPQLRRHFSGELLSVSPKIAKWVPGLFCLNERALYIGEWEHGFFSFTAVGECSFCSHIFKKNTEQNTVSSIGLYSTMSYVFFCI